MLGPTQETDQADRERAGRLVPNVVYSCGSLVHGNYSSSCAMSDYATTFATMPVDDVLTAME